MINCGSTKKNEFVLLLPQLLYVRRSINLYSEVCLLTVVCTIVRLRNVSLVDDFARTDSLIITLRSVKKVGFLFCKKNLEPFVFKRKQHGRFSKTFVASSLLT